MKSLQRSIQFGLSILLALPLACFFVATTGAQQPRKIKLDFKDVTLKNGLRVLVAEDHTAPVISVAITYDVGSRNERKGRTGLAHLFEHMMFTGSENVSNHEHMLHIFSNGGRANATTNENRTLYVATVPSNQLDMILFLEADRMRGLHLTQDGLDTQRSAVQEERRREIDNQAYASTSEKFLETMYDNFPYKHSVFGSMDDLNAASLEEVKDFFRVYYAPNNAALALVGDVKADVALTRIRNYFEAIPSQPAPPAVDTAEPEQTSERRFTVSDPLARLPRIVIGYKGIASNTPDTSAMQVLSQALAGGQSARLYQKLLKEKEIVTAIFGTLSELRGVGYYQIGALVAPGKKIEDVEAAIYEGIALLQREPIADWELEKAKKSSRRGSIQTLQTSLGTAIRLTQNAVFFNDPNLINTQFEKIAAVTKEDVQRVANKYFKATSRSVGITMPQAKTSTAAAHAANQ